MHRYNEILNLSHSNRRFMTVFNYINITIRSCYYFILHNYHHRSLHQSAIVSPFYVSEQWTIESKLSSWYTSRTTLRRIQLAGIFASTPQGKEGLVTNNTTIRGRGSVCLSPQWVHIIPRVCVLPMYE